MGMEEAKSVLRNAAWLGTNEERERIEKAVEVILGEPCKDTISRQAAIKAIYDNADRLNIAQAVRELPSVHAEPRTGHWIETAEEYYKAINEYGGGVNEDTPYFTDDCACSVCLAKFSVIDNEAERLQA